MTLRLYLRAAGAAIFTATIAISTLASAVEETTATLARNLRVVQTMSTLAQDLKDVLTPEIGFPQDYTEHWNAAVDAAFAPDLVEADFIKALDAQLSEKTRAAALVFDQSQLGQQIYELEMNAQPLKQDPDHLEKARERLEAGSAAENGLLVDLFEGLDGPERANAVMDLYFRAMVTAASPIIGVDAAEQWVGSAQNLRAGYVEDYFLTTIAVYGQLSQEQLEALTRTLATPELAAYSDQATLAFAETISAAADRLDRVYAANVAGQ